MPYPSFHLRHLAEIALIPLLGHTRAQLVSSTILEAYTGTQGTPRVANYGQLLHQVAEMLWYDSQDNRPIQLLYTYFVAAGSEKMDATLQDLGHYLVDRYGMPFERVEVLLNMVVKRLAALGELRAMQRGEHRQAIQHGGLISPERMMRGEW